MGGGCLVHPNQDTTRLVGRGLSRRVGDGGLDGSRALGGRRPGRRPGGPHGSAADERQGQGGGEEQVLH